MIWVIRGIVALVGLVGLVTVVGWLLPVAHEATRSAEFNRPPAEVFALVSDLPNYSTWWSGNSVEVVVVESVAPSRFATRIVNETAFGGTWTFDIEATPGGSRLTVTERGEVYNVLFRALARFVFGHAATMESFLAAAQRRLGSSAPS